MAPYPFYFTLVAVRVTFSNQPFPYFYIQEFFIPYSAATIISAADFLILDFYKLISSAGFLIVGLYKLISVADFLEILVLDLISIDDYLPLCVCMTGVV